MLCSATTVWNRSQPRNSRSIQAKKHVGKGLFCTAKPPKAEDIENESVHHQRAHVRNIQQFLCADEQCQKFSLIHSMDDKAYVRPGTSEGLEKTRRVKILNLASEGAKQLPKYDWPEKLVYQTPSAHRVMHKQVIDIDSKKRVVVEEDHHFVVIRPKAIIDSSGTTWASEIVRLRILTPDIFELPNERTVPEINRSYIAYLHAAAFLYFDMTESEDIKKITSLETCPHRKYELERLTHYLLEVQQAAVQFDM